MLNEETPDEVYRLTRKGELLMEMVESFQQMLLEQRQALITRVSGCMNALHNRDDFSAAEDLVNAMCIIGLEKFGK